MSGLRKKAVEAAEAKRLICNKGNETTESLLLHFDNILPKKVLLGMFNYSEGEYIPPPHRCFKCHCTGQVIYNRTMESRGVHGGE